MAAESLDIIVRMKDLASKEAKGLGRTLQQIAGDAKKAFVSTYKAIFNIPNALAAVTAGVGIQKLKEGLDLSADLESIQNGFENLSRKVGGSVAVLEALRVGTRGTVSDFRLMEVANKAMLLGVGGSAQEFEELAVLSRRLGRAVGRDATEAFADLTIGIGRQSRLILDNLGIVVPVEQAYKTFAQTLGVTVDSLTEAQKRTAFMTAVFAEARSMLKGMGADVWTFADSYGQLGAVLRNVRDDVLKSLTPMLQRIVQTIGDFIRDNKAEIFLFLSGVVDTLKEFVPLITEIGNALIVLSKILVTTAGGFNLLAKGVGGYLSDWATFISKVPDEAKKFKDTYTKYWHDIFGTLAAPWEDGGENIVPDIAASIASQSAKVSAESTGLMAVLDELQASLNKRAKNEKNKKAGVAPSAPKFFDIERSMWEAAKARTEKARTDYIAEEQQLADVFSKIDKLRAGVYMFQPPAEGMDNEWKLIDARMRDELGSIQDLEAAYEKLQQLRSDIYMTQPKSQGLTDAMDEAAMLLRAEGQLESPEYVKLLAEGSDIFLQDMIDAGMQAAENNEEYWEGVRATREQYELGAGVSAELRRMGDEAKSFGDIGALAMRDIGEGIADSMVDPLWDFISVTKDAGKAFAEMGKAILEMLGKIVLQETLTMGVKAAFSGIGGLFNASGEVPFSMSKMALPVGGWAGGVVPGHLQRVKGHFARGDVARERGLYELRERGQDEAVIPLVGNRYVPVKMMSTDPQGGSSKQIVNNFSFTFQGDSKQFARQLRENAEAVASIVAEKQNSSMRFREAMAA